MGAGWSDQPLSIRFGSSIHKQVTVPGLDEGKVDLNASENAVLNCFRLRFPAIPGMTQVIFLNTPLLLNGHPLPFGAVLPLIDCPCG